MKTKLLFFAIIMHSAISYALMPPPSNDDPCGATQLTVSNFCEITPFTCSGATPSVGYGNCGYAFPNNDVWFKLAVPASGNLTISTTGIIDSTWGTYPFSIMGVYSGSSCSSLTPIYDCYYSPGFDYTPYLNLTGRTPGETIWIRFWTFDPSAQCGICVSEPTPSPNPTIGSPMAGNSACEAPILDVLNGYYTNTSSTYTIETWPELTNSFEDFQNTYSMTNRVIDNNSFIKFTASSSIVSFNIWTHHCIGNNSGIQFFVFSSASCDSGPVKPYYWDYFNANSQNVCSLMGLIPGNTYYIMIDGINGDICDVVLSNSVLYTDIENTTKVSDAPEAKQAFYLPSFFNVNNEFFNSGFGPIGNISPESYTMKIFNLRGDLVFTTNDLNIRWNGSTNNRENKSDIIEGLYIYQIQFKDTDLNLLKEHYGKVTLIK